MRTLAFYRDFKGFTGGHLKVWDYFLHTHQSRAFRPTIYFTSTSRMDASNPWVAAGTKTETDWEPAKADALFLGGMDWLAVPDNCNVKVINLVQHVRHGDSADARYQFLSRRAIRICLSKEVELAILATGKVNGPVVTIPPGLDLGGLPEPSRERDIPLLIAGLKQPTLAKQLSEILAAKGVANTCLTSALPRHEFLGLLGRASVTLFLPHEEEGFYLPALEGFAMGTLVVCPDCVGNREFCNSETNCLMPTYTTEELLVACTAAVGAGPGFKNGLRESARVCAQRHGLEQERERYLKTLQCAVTGTF